MKHRQKVSRSLHGSCDDDHCLRIQYHSALGDGGFEAFAESAGEDPSSLRHAIERAIPMRLNEARIEPSSDRGRTDRADVYTLPLGTVRVHLSREEAAIMIRGLSWEIDGEPLDDFDGGGFYSN